GSSMAERDYVLGTHDEEIARLGLQHELWRPRMLAAWDRAGLKDGMRVVDVGAGPGYATVDLAARVGPRGEVVAVERSARFAAHGTAQCRARGLAQVRYVESDVMQPLPATGMDASWCRWVGSFVPSPETLIANVAAALKSGGVALFHEYADYRTWRMAPRRPLLEEFVGHVMASWRDAGSEPDVALALPALLRQHGFALRHVEPVIFSVAAGEPLWRWLAAYVETGPRRLLELGRVDAAWIGRLHAEFRAAAGDGVTRMTTPMLFEIVAERT
ncbi:MAG: class I SAM-dependent methyltransferase, partial [Nevskiaceae bacterium]